MTQHKMSDTVTDGNSTINKVYAALIIGDTVVLGILAWQFYTKSNALQEQINKLEESNKRIEKQLTSLKDKLSEQKGIINTLQEHEEKLETTVTKEDITELVDKVDSIMIALDENNIDIRNEPKKTKKTKFKKTKKSKKSKKNMSTTSEDSDIDPDDIYAEFERSERKSKR